MSRTMSTKIVAALFATATGLVAATSSATAQSPYDYGYEYSYMWDSSDITGAYFGYNDPTSSGYSYTIAYSGYGYNPAYYYNPYYNDTYDNLYLNPYYYYAVTNSDERGSLVNATSVASLLLTTDSAITELLGN
ncbi:MAG: hypothetical protein VX527_03745 [Planctomycetota bacterium]|nr:hypothetical protein [Planctomycetota bacterium]